MNIAAPAENASITVDSGATITASTISLTATSSSTETISNTNASALSITHASIGTTNSAEIAINGTLDAAGGAVSVISNLTIDDTIDNTGGFAIHSVGVTANNTASVTFSPTAVVSAGTLDAEANTTINSSISADHLGAGVLPGFVPASLADIAVEVSQNVTNSTTVTVDSGATIGVGAGTISLAKPVAAYLAANDSTDLTTAVTLDDPASLPVVGNVLVFSALDSSDTLSRTTSVDVGNLAATAAPSTSAASTLLGGDVALSATSGGAISNSETSTGLGTVEINAGGSNGNSTSVEVSGVNVNVGALSLTALSNTSYADSGHLSSLTVGGGTEATLSDSGATVATDGLVVSAEDNSTLSTSSVAPNFDPSTATETTGSPGDSGTPGASGSGLDIAVDRTTSVIAFDKNTTAIVTGSMVSSSGAVRVEAVDNASLSSAAVMAAQSTSSGGASVSGGGGLAANIVQGAVSASIEGSTITTTGGGDVSVLAGDSSLVSSRAETSASATGTSTAVGVAGTVALNVIGWAIDTSGGGLLGRDDRHAVRHGQSPGPTVADQRHGGRETRPTSPPRSPIR